MAEVMNELTRYRDSWFAKPAGVLSRRVCALSGAPLGPACTAAVQDWFIPGVSSQQPCALHQRLTFDKTTGYEVCKVCMTKAASAYTEKTVTIWPPEVAAYLRQQGKAAGLEIAHNPECPALLSPAGLKIKSPLPHSSFALTKALTPASQKIPLSAQCQHPADKVFWYVDQKLFGPARPDETLYLQPQPGRHLISVVNTRGQMDKVEISVTRP